jgi:hypothetical protein
MTDRPVLAGIGVAQNSDHAARGIHADLVIKLGEFVDSVD